MGFERKRGRRMGFERKRGRIGIGRRRGRKMRGGREGGGKISMGDGVCAGDGNELAGFRLAVGA
jgi:hypothetical protein